MPKHAYTPRARATWLLREPVLHGKVKRSKQINKLIEPHEKLDIYIYIYIYMPTGKMAQDEEVRNGPTLFSCDGLSGFCCHFCGGERFRENFCLGWTPTICI